VALGVRTSGAVMGSRGTWPLVSGPMQGGDGVPGDLALGVRTRGGGDDGVPADLPLGVRTNAGW